MKKIIFFLLATVPFFGNSQSVNYVILKKPGGKLCDTCYVSNIFNIEYPVSYVFVNAINENVSTDSNLYKQSGTGLKNVSKHFTSSGNFTLNLLPRYLPDIKNPYSTRRLPNVDDTYKEFHFRVWKNTQANDDWKNIKSLPKDTTSAIFYKLEGGDIFKDVTQPIEWPNFSAGVYQLNINDSLIIKIRKANSEEIVQTIFIKRVAVIPSFFDFIHVPGTADLQAILNFGLNTSSGLIADSVNEIEITRSDSWLLRFGNAYSDDKIIEYSWDDTPGQWYELKKGGNQNVINPHLYLLLKKPAPGRHLELLLRYKHQPQSVRRIKIKTTEPPSQVSWIKIGASFMLAFCLFGVWYYFKQKKHKRQLLAVTRKKEDIETKLQLLSGQLNPHFLFNSLNAIQSFINKNDVEKANSYVNEVATFMRTVMDTGRKEFISLKEEIEMEENYVQLERKRRSFHYSIQNKCSRDLAQVEFPPLLLQPVIENSIRHGLGKNIPNPIIAIEINCQHMDLIVTITDNGSGFDTTTITEGHGLSLIKKRIALLNEKLDQMKIDLHVRSEEGKGVTTIFTFKNWLQ